MGFGKKFRKRFRRALGKDFGRIAIGAVTFGMSEAALAVTQPFRSQAHDARVGERTLMNQMADSEARAEARLRADEAATIAQEKSRQRTRLSALSSGGTRGGSLLTSPIGLLGEPILARRSLLGDD